MPVSHIEHFLFAADDIDATRDWYARVLGMKAGPHPDFGFPVHWMYVDEIDIVHIGPSAKKADDIQKKYLGRTSQDSGSGTGALDHIAFRATGLRRMLEHLRKEKIPFTQRGQHRAASAPHRGTRRPPPRRSGSRPRPSSAGAPARRRSSR